MTTKQMKAAALIVGLLILLNIALIMRISFQRNLEPPRGRNQDAKGILVKELSLNSSQVKSFDSLRAIHFREIGVLQQEMRLLKDSFFNNLHDQSASPDSIAVAIGQVQSKIEIATYRHFAAVRNLCSPEQQQKFDNIIHDILRNMGPERRGGPRPAIRP